MLEHVFNQILSYYSPEVLFGRNIGYFYGKYPV
jgi:hypothetical protein